ncbi:MAG: FGGY family carbohydrate kinase [Cyclobacteriaceae bacterium]
MQKVTAIFDIGKTNKKFFLFDSHFKEVYHEYTRFEEVEDDDGFLSEDLDKLVSWIKETFHTAIENPEFDVQSLNFSTYGASLVHLDDNGQLAAPFYNYLKPFPEDLKEQFLAAHGSLEEFQLDTASPFMGLLNSGLQLYYLKYRKPEIFKNIKRSVQFPQYLSSLFTDQYFADYTSIGCHTGMWEYGNGKYASWLKKEGLDGLLDPVTSSQKSIPVQIGDKTVSVGLGIHDSSSALIPYMNGSEEEFTLISTGTWSICMNLYNHEQLTLDELERDCLNFMNINGLSTKSSRLFLGKHLSESARRLSDYYGVDYQSYKSIKWSGQFTSKRKSKNELLLDHSLVMPERFGFINCEHPDYDLFDNYEDALTHLFDEITDIQIASLKLALGNSGVKTIYVDGGFSASKVFIQFMANKLPGYRINSTSFSLGSALGAAIVVNHRKLPENFLKEVYNVKLHPAQL